MKKVMIMLSVLLEVQIDPIWYVAAAVLPALLVIIMATTTFSRKHMKISPVEIKNPIKVVGYKTEITYENHLEKDNELWPKFKKVRDSIPNKKEEFSFMTLIENRPQPPYPYYIGVIVNDFTQVPEGMFTIEVPVGLYAAGKRNISNPKKWVKSIPIVGRCMKKWIEKSKLYELNPDATVCKMEYHKKDSKEHTTEIFFYEAIRPKSKS